MLSNSLLSNSQLGSRQNDRRSDDSNMIPLINIVFLMLIFFMVAGKIAVIDRAQYDAPHTVLKAQTIEEEHTLIVAADHTLWVNDKPSGAIEALGPVAWNQIAADLANANHVIVKLDANLPASLIDPLLTTLRDSNIQSLQLAVQQSGEPTQ